MEPTADKLEQLLIELHAIRQSIDADLRGYLRNDKKLLDMLFDSINYTLFSGGKRIRPLFCFMVGDLFDLPRHRLRSLGCALEMIHTASLIMDDLPHMDGGKIRRGKTANHLIYGQDVAALASIGLLTKAYEIVLGDDGIPPEKKNTIVGMLANVVGLNGMVGGQFVDLKFKMPSVDHEIFEYIHLHKTAALFVASGTAAAVLGNAAPPEITALETYSQKLGFAFQILDDILDATGTCENLGKPVQADAGNFVALFGLEKARLLVQENTRAALDAAEHFRDKGDTLKLLAQLLLKRHN